MLIAINVWDRSKPAVDPAKLSLLIEELPTYLPDIDPRRETLMERKENRLERRRNSDLYILVAHNPLNYVPLKQAGQTVQTLQGVACSSVCDRPYKLVGPAESLWAADCGGGFFSRCSAGTITSG